MILSSHGIIGSSIVQSTLLLDVYPNAAAAYSLRKLRTAYTGSGIEVRRTNNDVADIGFTSTGELDTAALLAFTGTGALDNGFVTKWYDQSGNGRNATQTIALNQPQIVSSGSVLTINGKPRIDFDGTNDTLSITSFTGASANYNSFVGRRNSAGRRLMGLAGNQYLWALWSDNNYYLQNSTTGYQASSSADSSTSHLLLTGLRESGGNQKMYKNGNEILSTFTSLSLSTNINSIGLYTPSFYAFCELQEIVYYNSAQESNRTGIETNINDFYSIY
jgi:hypothetical protein